MDAEFEIETIGELKRLIEPFMDDTKIVLAEDGFEPLKIKYMIPSGGISAYLKVMIK
ncbi:MAG: hypothetical protein JRC86_06815 [Deltaproteobacteria bacterium]|nr:hypothetical protein [Deltaproteobacteria bacterium]